MVSGSSEMICTVESAQPTACTRWNVSERLDPVRGTSSTHEVGGPLPAFGHLSNAHRQDLGAHLLALLELVQLSIEVQLKVDDLARVERRDDLPLVRSSADNGLIRPNLPFVDALVGKNVSNAARVDLEKSVVAELLNAEGGRRRDETRIADLLNRVANRQDEGTVDE